MKKLNNKTVLLSAVIALLIGATLLYFFSHKYSPPEWVLRSSMGRMSINDYYDVLARSKLSDGSSLNLSWSEKDFIFNGGYVDNQLNGKEYHLEIRSPDLNETLVFQPNVYPSSREFPPQHVVIFEDTHPSDFKDLFDKRIKSKLVYESDLPVEVLDSKVSRSDKTIADIISKYPYLDKKEWTVDFGAYKKEVVHNGIYAKFIIRPVDSDWYFEIKQRYQKRYHDTNQPYFEYYSYYHSEFLNMDLNDSLEKIIFKISEDSQ